MKLSVAMCTYNGALYIEEQLDSILHQSVPVDEIVVCDDGSTDDTIKIIELYIEQNPNISWVLKKNPTNLGVVKNFEQALYLCTGDIIFLSDQDDVWENVKTERILSYFYQNPAVSVLFTDAYLIDGGGGGYKPSLFDVNIVAMNQLRDVWESGMLFEMLNAECRATGATMAIKKNILSDLLPLHLDMGLLHDGLLVAEGCKKGVLGVLYEPLIRYRLHKGNTVGININVPSKHGALYWMIEPRNIRPCFNNYVGTVIEKRVRFYKFRYDNYHTLQGKLKLLFAFISYIKFYKSYASIIWWNDVSFGFRKWITRRK